MKILKSFLTGAALFSLIFGASSCNDSFIFEDERDCTVKVQFVFKKHRQALHQIPGKEADVFASTVNTVHLFVYDAESGELVSEHIEKAENLNSAAELKMGSGTDKCYLPLNLDPGKYRMVAWCGLDEDDTNNAFYLTDGSTRGKYAECRVKLSDATGHPVNSAKYDALYHGIVKEAEVSVSNDGTQVIPVELTKNNNDIAVWVQHTTTTFSEGEYEVVYTDANGTLKFEDNSVPAENHLEYHPHTTSMLTSSTEYNGSSVEAGALVAHLSTSRLMEAHQNNARIEVRNKEGETVFSIPFIKYLLQMQTFTNDGQYYLDCEDTFNCSFYLTGENGAWIPARIIINNWVKVPDQDADI